MAKEEKSKDLVLTKEEKSLLSLKNILNTKYKAQITNFFNDETKSLKFLSAVSSDIQRNPALLECEPSTIINSYMVMAQLNFNPSGVSGEGYVLPYNKTIKLGKDDKGKDIWKTIKQAQFQLGYQGLVTLFYQAGVEKITSDIVRENDIFKQVNGEIYHEVNLTKSFEERGKPVGAYVSVFFRGQKNTYYMNGKDILDHGQKFSKSFDVNGKYSPWNIANDPSLHMWRKTVLKQMSKYLPKNEIINKAIALDNRDSVISDRLTPALKESSSLKMGNLITIPNEKQKTKNKETEEVEDEIDYLAEGIEEHGTE